MSQERVQPAPAEEQEAAGLIDRLKLYGAVIAAAALILFFFQNLQRVEIHFLWLDWTTRMIWALIISAALGAAGMLLAATIRRRRKRPPLERQGSGVTASGTPPRARR